MKHSIIDKSRENAKSFESKAKAQAKASELKEMVDDPESISVVQGSFTSYAEYKGRADGGTVDVVEHTDTKDEQAQTQDVAVTDELRDNPIAWLESINTDFVNTVQGTQAISKQGFRYIQHEFEITTKSEVVTMTDDPFGCVVWAKAELPNGRSAEAHGEGYINEERVDDNEFVRYADTRAKSRALSDLTSAGALAVEELK
jgi:hypothetical protein